MDAQNKFPPSSQGAMHAMAKACHRISERDVLGIFGGAVRKVLREEVSFVPGRVRRWLSDVVFAKADAMLKRKCHDYEFREYPVEFITKVENMGGGKFVLFAAGDMAYVNRYARAFAESASISADNCIIHIHVWSDDSIVYESLNKIFPENILKKISVTLSGLGENLLEEGDIGRFCQVSRFFIVKKIMDYYNMPVLCLDIDSVMCSDPYDELLGIATGKDIGLHVRWSEKSQGKKVLAGAAWFSPTRAAKAYLDRAVRHMHLHVQKCFFIEKLDQRILWLTFLEMKEECKFFQIPTSFINSQANGAVIMHMKGNKKSHDI